MHDEMREPTEEELRAAMEEQMSRVRVEDVILQSVATLVNLAGRRLGLAGTEAERDLDQAKLAIDAARALVPLAAEEQQEPIRQALTPGADGLRPRGGSAGGRRAGARGRGGGDAGEWPTGAGHEGRRGGRARQGALEDLDAARYLSEAVGIFGGSGFYSLLDEVEEVAVDTPYGPPSARIRDRRRSRARGWRSCRATATSTRCRRTASTTARTCGR